MGLKVAVVGLAASTRSGTPFDSDWEVWGLPWDTELWPRFHRTFEIHADWKRANANAYIERLKECAGLYMALAYPEVPNAQRFPVEDVAQTTTDYLASSIAYMVALAIHERAQEIAIYGVNMEAAGEYGYQKPNLEYLIGLARGRGIVVTIHPDSPLCKFVNDKSGPTYSGRYGWAGA
jgi:hypothetical protein